MSALGVIAAMVGGWILLAPDDGTLSFFGRTWAASELTTTWGPSLLIVGGAATAVGMSISAVRGRKYETNAWLTVAEALLAVAGVVAMIAGVVILL
jgi:Na+/H+ antiporter NhaD/arsenite permease-like protein